VLQHDAEPHARAARHGDQLLRAVVISSGFSIRICLPATAQRRTSSRWVLGGVSSITASIVRSSRIASSRSTIGNGNLPAKEARRAALGE
jgi:hypothetical protein